jgi:carboxypeptidase C (cathepsin A)
MGYQIKSSFKPWYVNGYVAGHTISYETSSSSSTSSSNNNNDGRKNSDAVETEFTFLTVAGAGHMVPHYRPVEALEMLKRFLANKGY